MTRRAISTLTGLLGIALGPLALAGCPGPAATTDDMGAGDSGVPRDAPRLDAIGADAPGRDASGADSPIAMADAWMGVDSGPTTCSVTGYPRLDATDIATGLTEPVFITGAPGTTDLFILQKSGEILVRSASGADIGVFLDISGQISDSGESGLLGLAFHPDYATNGRFYVYYTENVDGSGVGPDQVVAVGTRNTAHVANPTVEVILRMADQAGNHNGGCLQFGPDGELYIATGDGGPQGDPEGDAQNPDSILGKILRIHVDATTGTGYTIPTGNPFASSAGLDEIYAVGLRNPWRFSFDRGTADLYVGDVGASDWEEISVVDSRSGAGTNFGWNECEGFRGFTSGAGSDCTFADYDPVLAVSHGTDPVLGGSNGAITGGYVYRGTAIPPLVGAYIFGDYSSGSVGAFRYCAGAMTEYRQLDDLTGLCDGIASFGQDNLGELYMVCLNSGSIMRIVAR